MADINKKPSNLKASSSKAQQVVSPIPKVRFTLPGKAVARIHTLPRLPHQQAKTLIFTPPHMIIRAKSMFPRVSDFKVSNESEPFCTTLFPSSPNPATLPTPSVVLRLMQQLTVKEEKAIPWNYPPTHNSSKEPAVEIDLITRSGRAYVPEKMKKKEIPRATPKKTNKLMKILKKSDYNIIDQLRRLPAQISLLELMISSEEHRNTVINVLKQAHMPREIEPEALGEMIGNIIATRDITFTDNKMPEGGKDNMRPLHIVVKTRGLIVSRVLIDYGSVINVCPLITYKRLGLQEDQLHSSGVVIRAFDGVKSDPLGEVDLTIEVGLVQFDIKFQVLNIPAAYNLPIRRP